MAIKTGNIFKTTVSLLKSRRLVLSAAESCTGGLFSDTITNIAGASKCFAGSVVTYCNESKVRVLKVPRETLKESGAVSPETSLKMAQGAQKLFSSNIAVSVTGIAGPHGATKTKPVGLVYISLFTPEGGMTKKFIFSGSRSTIKRLAAAKMHELLSNYLRSTK